MEGLEWAAGTRYGSPIWLMNAVVGGCRACYWRWNTAITRDGSLAWLEERVETTTQGRDVE